jgi:hypothetical protein
MGAPVYFSGYGVCPMGHALRDIAIIRKEDAVAGGG